jgi:hypothetical protein
MKAVAQARGALDALAALLPDSAERITESGVEKVPLSQLRVGDVILVGPRRHFEFGSMILESLHPLGAEILAHLDRSVGAVIQIETERFRCTVLADFNKRTVRFVISDPRAIRPKSVARFTPLFSPPAIALEMQNQFFASGTDIHGRGGIRCTLRIFRPVATPSRYMCSPLRIIRTISWRA